MRPQLADFLERAGFTDYAALHAWSIAAPEAFWSLLWDYLGILGDPGEVVLDRGATLADARFFPAGRLSFAENLLRRRDDAIAVVAHATTRTTITYAQLARRVAQAADGYRALGVTIGDRVACALPNTIDAIVAMLGANAVGAIASICDLELGALAVVDRFGQIEPRILVGAAGAKLDEVRARLPSVEHVVTELASFGDAHAPERFERVPFNTPAFILYTSGTTGLPKCIVHNTGGQLLQLLKEHRLHYDLRRDDVYFQQTSTGWNMWYWVIIALAAEATIVLREGSPLRPALDALFALVDAERVTHFGLSPAYLAQMKTSGVVAKDAYRFEALRVVASTGSVISPALFDYVYETIKADVHLISLSGGTEINACFATGNPLAPVHRGELQVPALGMATDVFDDAGRSIRLARGELVCTAPFPSQPVGLWNDPERRRYLATYFERFPGAWHHGDYIETTVHGGYVIHGRSDATLKPGGHRIGTAEIYRPLEGLAAIEDAVAIGQHWREDVRVVLFVKLRAGQLLDGALEKQIRTTILAATSSHHVPARIVAVTDIPYTRTGKKAEIAVRQVVHGEPVANTAALANPEALALYRDVPALRR